MKRTLVLLAALALAGCADFKVGSYCAYAQNCNITAPAAKGA